MGVVYLQTLGVIFLKWSNFEAASYVSVKKYVVYISHDISLTMCFRPAISKWNDNAQLPACYTRRGGFYKMFIN